MESLCWDDLRVLLAVHRAGSLLGAGRSLRLSTSTTGRRLAALEAAVGEKLVHRTQVGTQLAPAALPLVRLAQELEHGLRARQRDKQLVAGTIRISVPDGMAVLVAQALLAVQYQHPGIDLELMGENRMVDVAKREADMAIRLVRSTSNLVVERRLATLRFSLFASADYVQRHLPEGLLRKADASKHPFVGLDTRWKGLPHEQWMVALGATRFAFRSSSIEAIVEAVRRGAGLAALVEQDARHAELIRVGTDTAGPTQPLYLIYHRDLRNAPHVRAAVSSIEAHIRGGGS
jgi:DNA-binding transcriptional LysR family regulator